MDDALIMHLGPLAALASVWEGDKGNDTAPSDDRGAETNLFRERIRCEPFGPVEVELTVTLNDDGSLRYEEDTQLKMPGRPDVFHHRDRNTLRRVGPA